MKAKLTDTCIRSYQPRAAQHSIGDAACPGLCIRIIPESIKTFAFAYHDKTTGKVTWLTVGRYPDVPLTKAREVVARRVLPWLGLLAFGPRLTCPRYADERHRRRAWPAVPVVAMRES